MKAAAGTKDSSLGERLTTLFAEHFGLSPFADAKAIRKYGEDGGIVPCSNDSGKVEIYFLILKRL
jgi:hypothetical protein